MKNLSVLSFIAFILMLMALGCSNANNPIGASDSQIEKVSFDSIPIGVTDYFTDGTPAAGTGTLGLFELNIDPIELSADLTSLRSSALTDVLEVVDITNFLTMAPCADCAKIKSVALNNDGNLVVSIGIKHPFGVGDPFKPITGRNRGDLHVFNVEGTLISNADGSSFGPIGATVANTGMVNPDGYSGYLDSSIDTIFPTNATVHPYKLHFDDYSAGNFSPTNPMGFQSVTTPPPSGNLVMAMGCDYDYQDYIFAPTANPFHYIFAIGCSYAVSSASKSTRFEPEYRVPQHNKKAPSEVSIAIISNDLAAGDTSSQAQIEVQVVDINHGVAVGSALNEMLSDSSVDDIFIYVPGVTSSQVVLDGNTPVSGTGHSPSDPLIYAGTITNSSGGAEGTYTGLVKVTDKYAPGQNTSPLLQGMDGIKRVDPLLNPLTGLFAISDFATYQLFTIDISTGNDKPVAILTPDPAMCEMGERIDFDGTASYDTDGAIVLYEFDFIWDGIEANFVADESNTDGVVQSFPYASQGSFKAGLRVTDDLGAVDYDMVDVTVSEVTNVIYVDDSNTTGIEDGSMQHPFNTIMEGVAAATSGYKIWVDDSGNDYNEYVLINGKNNIILKSVNWAPSDGGNMASIYRSSNYILAIQNSTNFTVDGFKIHGSVDYGVQMSNAPQSTIRNCWITEIGQTGTNVFTTAASFSSSPGAVFEDNEISNCELHVTGGFIFAIYASNSPMTIRGNTIHDMRKTLGSGFNEVMFFTNCTPSGGYELEIYQNKIHNIQMADSGFLIGIYIYCNVTESTYSIICSMISTKIRREELWEFIAMGLQIPK